MSAIERVEAASKAVMRGPLVQMLLLRALSRPDLEVPRDFRAHNVLSQRDAARNVVVDRRGGPRPDVGR